MIIRFEQPTEIILVRQESLSLQSLTVERIVDLPLEKTLIVHISELGQPIVLWEGEEYDRIGDWTKELITNKIIALYSEIK
jgi:hypothetical protein